MTVIATPVRDAGAGAGARRGAGGACAGGAVCGAGAGVCANDPFAKRNNKLKQSSVLVRISALCLHRRLSASVQEQPCTERERAGTGNAEEVADAVRDLFGISAPGDQ